MKVAEFARRYIPFFNRLINDWSLNQDCRIIDQLRMGIRAFDFRLSANDNGDLFLSHSFACIPLEEAFMDIAEFMSSEEGRNEVIFIWAQPGKRNRVEQIYKDMYMEKLRFYLGDILTPKQSTFKGEPFPTLRECLERNHRIFLIGPLHRWWQKMYKSMKGIHLYDSPNEEVIREDIRNRILHPFRYERKGLRNWNGTTEENYNRLKEEGKLENINFVWCDFPVESIIVDFFS